MKIFLLLLATVASAWAADISKFKSISVTQTNYQNEAVVTNGLTLGGVRNTSWPAGATAGTVINSGTPVDGALMIYNGTTGTNAKPAGITIGSLTNLTVPGKTTIANTLALRNGTSAQVFNVYNTYTDSSNYERAALKWSGNALILTTESAGTGVGRAIEFSPASNLTFKYGGSTKGQLTSSGWNFAADVLFTDNTYDIGASGATRPRALYLAQTVNSASGTSAINQIQLTSGLSLLWASKSRITCSVDGSIVLTDNAQATFGLLQFGGTSSSFPALKRSSTTLQVRLADDSGDAPLSANDLTLSKTITAGGTTGTQTINKASGSVNFAAAAQTLVVTNSLVTANSVIMATVATDDTTAFACKAIPASGQFTLKLNAAATAETRVSFLVTN